MPIKKTPKPKAQYRRRDRESYSSSSSSSSSNIPHSAIHNPHSADLPHAHPLEPRHFELRDDGTIQGNPPSSILHPQSAPSEGGRPTDFSSSEKTAASVQTAAPNLIFSHGQPFLRLYHGDCFALLDAIAAKYPHGRFDAIFADPPYFLSNGGITCHAGKMVKADKGDWDKSRGPELNHEFNHEWLKRCQRVLKPNGTIWVSGTHHVIFSIGYAMQQLGFKILNDIAWEKPNPPPNLSCRYFTHSTETILWAAKNEKSKHVFNYSEMKAVTGKQMKTVWRELGAEGNHSHAHRHPHPQAGDNPQSSILHPRSAEDEGGRKSPQLNSIWTLSAPGSDEKTHGKHPTQKPVALIERCLLASTNAGDLVLDPFLGGGTTAIAALKLNRGCVGIEADFVHITLAVKRADNEIVSIWLRHFSVAITVTVSANATPAQVTAVPSPINLKRAVAVPSPRPSDGRGEGQGEVRAPGMVLLDPAQIDLDLAFNSINGSRVDDKPQSQIPTERIFHETKFVFLSCAEVERGAVVHTTVDVSLQEAWAKTPTGKKRETTHIVRCETEIFRLRETKN